MMQCNIFCAFSEAWDGQGGCRVVVPIYGDRGMFTVKQDK